jgi:hypothetical protein
MFKTIHNLAVCVAVLSAGTNTLADDKDAELYSDVRAGVVFATSIDDSSAAGDLSRVRRLTSTEQVEQLLKDAGFESLRIDGRTVVTTRTLEPWVFPVSVGVAEDEKTLNLVIGLASIKDAKTISSDKLLALLEASKKHAPSQFVFNSDRKRIELFGQIRNENLQSQTLRDEISRLVILAKDSEALWRSDAAQDAASRNSVLESDVAIRSTSVAPTTAVRPTESVSVVQPATPGSSTASIPPTNPTSTSTAAAAPTVALTSTAQLLGRWSGSRSSTEAFAILFDAQGKFVLVSIQNGKQTRSSGTFGLNETVLTLTGSDGLKLTGTVSLKSESEFDFLPQTNGATAVALNFRKAR